MPGNGHYVLDSATDVVRKAHDESQWLSGPNLYIVTCVAPSSWQAWNLWFSKSNDAGAQRGFYPRIRSDGQMRLEWSSDGLNALTANSGATLASTPTDQHRWLAYEFIGDNGAGGHTLRFWYSDDPIETARADVTWTQLGSDVVIAGTSSIFNSTADLLLGAREYSGGLADNGTGKRFYLAYFNGKGGSLVHESDFRLSDQTENGWVPSAGTDYVANTIEPPDERPIKKIYRNGVWVEGRLNYPASAWVL